MIISRNYIYVIKYKYIIKKETIDKQAIIFLKKNKQYKNFIIYF
jgi:hypothetical protein